MTVNTVKSIIDAKEEIRVKRLGFLRDKTTADRFNARVITRNGKVTAEELCKNFRQRGNHNDQPSYR